MPLGPLALTIYKNRKRKTNASAALPRVMMMKKGRNQRMKSMHKLMIFLLALGLFAALLPAGALAANGSYQWLDTVYSGPGTGVVNVYKEVAGGRQRVNDWDWLDVNDVVLIEVLCAPYCELAHIEINFSEQDGRVGTGSWSADNFIFQKEGENSYRFKNADLPEQWQRLSNKRAVVRFVPTQAAHSLDSVVAGAGGSLTCNILKPGGGAIKWAEKGAEVFASPRANDGYSLVGLYLLPKDAPLPTGDFSIASDFTPLGNNYQFTMPDYDAKVVAVFRSQQTGTVTLSAQPAEGGTVTGGGQYQLGSLVTVKATPAEEYKFVRWVENVGAGLYVSTQEEYTFGLTANKSLTAVFEPRKYTVTVSASPVGVAADSLTGGGQYLPGATVTLNARAADRFLFKQWYSADVNGIEGQAGAWNATFIMPAKNVNVQAQFKYKTNLKLELDDIEVYLNEGQFLWTKVRLFNAYDGGRLSFTKNDLHLLCDGKPVDAANWTLADTETVRIDIDKLNLDAGDYTFSARYLGNEDFVASETNNGDVRVHPKRIATKLLNIAPTRAAAGQGFTVSGRLLDENDQPVPDARVYIEIRTERGWEGGWAAMNPDGSFRRDFSSDFALAAGEKRDLRVTSAASDPIGDNTYRHTQYEGTIEFVSHLTVSFDTKGGSPVPPDQQVKYGKYAQKPAKNQEPTLPGYQFYGWYGDINAFEFAETPITADTTIYARYSGDVTLKTYDATNKQAKSGGKVALSPKDGYWSTELDREVSSHQFDNQVMQATAQADEGFAFVKWTVGNENGATVSTDSIFDFKPIEYLTLCAVFERTDTHAVTVSASPAEGGTVSGGGTYAAGASATVTATANAGYEFAGWYEGDECVSWEEAYTIASVTGDMTLTAKFTKMWTATIDMNGGEIFDGEGWKSSVSMDFEDGFKHEIPTADDMETFIDEGTWIKAPANSRYTGAEIDGVTYQPGQTYELKKDTTIKVLWASDQPQPAYTVTYVVVNGTWADGTTASKTEEVENGQSPSQIPTGMITSEGFEGGAWDTDPNGAAITGNTTFTYTFLAAANKTYVFTKGDSAFWTKGSAAALDFTVTGMPDDSKTFAAFTGIEVDGASVAAENYTAAAGSVNISLKSAYLEGLAAGEHTITARFADGSAQAKFIIKDKETPAPVYDFKFTFTKIWQGGHEDSIDWVLYYPNGTVARKKFNKKIVSESEWRYEAWFASGADYYIIEKPVDGYTVRYENVGAYADVTDRCYNGGTIINYKVPKTGDTANPRLWAGMMLLGVGAVCGTLVFGRRKKENR